MTTDLEENILLDEISWQQKSRVLWLKEGDKNTKYFHSVANSHRRNNAIRQLNINNVVSSDQEAILDFKLLPTSVPEDVSLRPTLDGLVHYPWKKQPVWKAHLKNWKL